MYTGAMTSFPNHLPHGSLTSVVDGLYCVRGSFGMGPGVKIGRTMTVVKTGTVWSLPGASLGQLSVDRSLSAEGPIAGSVVVDYGETAGFREGAYLVPMGGGTLVTCDAIQNCADTDGASFLGRMIMSVMGFKGGVVVPPMWRRFQKVKGPRVGETLSGVVDLSFANLVTGHGPPVVEGADAMVRSAIERASA